MDSTMNRRNFLKGASMASLYAATGVGVGSTPALAEPQIKRIGGPKLKISLNAYSFSKMLNDYKKDPTKGISLFDLLDFCAKNNFDALDATGYFFPGYPSELPTDAFINEFKRRAFELGLDISGTGVRNNFTLPDKDKRAADVKHIKQWVEVAAKMGAPVLRVFADTQMKGQSWQTVAPDFKREQVEDWIVENLKECADCGKQYGVIIGVQNHGDFLKTAENLLHLIGRVDSVWCGPIVDTGYFVSKDPYEDMAKVAPHAVNWQIKTSPFGAESGIKTDLKRLIGIVRTSGYRGYIPIETLSVKGAPYDPFDAVPKFLAEIREVLGTTT
ncbi:sugar phosphate isomerase/epimerase [bacterium]|nr:MAG: sugar phosphate isomerase/epimerase [bacterium]